MSPSGALPRAAALAPAPSHLLSSGLTRGPMPQGPERAAPGPRVKPEDDIEKQG